MSLLAAMLILPQTRGMASAADTVKFGSFGKVVIYRPPGEVKSVVLFISGDGGWNLGVVDMARDFTAQGALVAGIDILSYYRGLKQGNPECYYPAGDLEELSIMLQKKYQLEQYHKPILVGYSSGATLVYGILAQAPANTFKGAISLGFCPDIEIPKPLCAGDGLKQHPIKEGHSYYLEASTGLTAPFIALHGVQDQVCPLQATRDYLKLVNTGQLIELPKVGHGFSVASSWLPQFIDAYNRVLKYPAFTGQKPVRDTLTPSSGIAPPPGDFPIFPIPSVIRDTLPMAFLISGDGGWTDFDFGIGKWLADKGIPVIGLDAQKYFWKHKTPDETAAEVAKAVQYYMKPWQRTKFILVGYSFGACVVPFIATHLTGNLKGQLSGIYCISPDLTVDFEIHLIDMMGIRRPGDSFQVIDEINAIRTIDKVCIFGESEDPGLRKKFASTGARIVTTPGSHHYNGKPSLPAGAVFQEVMNSKSHPDIK
jgi:type IV secretory pathway VirJ component